MKHQERNMHLDKNIIKEVEEDHRWHGPFGNHDVQKELKPSVSRYKEILGDDIGNEIISGFEWFYQMFSEVIAANCKI